MDLFPSDLGEGVELFPCGLGVELFSEQEYKKGSGGVFGITRNSSVRFGQELAQPSNLVTCSSV